MSLHLRDAPLPGAEAASQDADVGGVHVGERRGEQVGSPRRVDVGRVGGVGDVGVDRDRQGVEQRGNSGLPHERGVVGGDLDRHAGGQERPPQTGDRRTPRADQDRHVRPGQAVLEVGPAQQVGEVLGLGAVGVVGEQLDPPVVGGVGRGCEEPLQRVTGYAGGQRQAGRDPLGRTQDVGPEASGRAEDDRVGGLAVGAREHPGELEDPAHLCSAEAVDRLVGVADDHQLPGRRTEAGVRVSGDRPEQGDLGGVGVLVFVDEDVGVVPAQLVAHRLLRILQHPHRRGDQAGVVEEVLVGRDHVVLLHEGRCRDVFGQALAQAELSEGVPPETLLLGAGQHLGDLAGEPAGAECAGDRLGPDDRLGLAGQDLLEHDVLLGGRQQPQGLVVELARGPLSDQAVGERVERRAGRARHRAAHAGGDPVAEVLGGLAREGQPEDGVGMDATMLDPVGDRLDQSGGLAGPGAGEHEQGTSLVVDHPLLLGIEGHRPGRGPLGAHEVERRGPDGHGPTQPSATDRPGRAH